MARLIPKINPDEIENSGERMLAKSLISQLGAEVEVYHSFRWLAENERGTLDEGVLLSSAKRFKGLEADAVVILCAPPEEEDELMEQYVARSRAKHVLVVIEVGE
jgi:DNA helicase IV